MNGSISFIGHDISQAMQIQLLNKTKLRESLGF